jgi:hypothetical protein
VVGTFQFSMAIGGTGFLSPQQIRGFPQFVFYSLLFSQFRIITRIESFSCSDLPCPGCFLWSHVKGTDCKNNPQTSDELKTTLAWRLQKSNAPIFAEFLE